MFSSGSIAVSFLNGFLCCANFPISCQPICQLFPELTRVLFRNIHVVKRRPDGFRSYTEALDPPPSADFCTGLSSLPSTTCWGPCLFSNVRLWHSVAIAVWNDIQALHSAPLSHIWSWCYATFVVFLQYVFRPTVWVHSISTAYLEALWHLQRYSLLRVAWAVLGLLWFFVLGLLFVFI